jgi:hypothetical protein
MEWTNIDEFKRKYDSSVNPGNWARRASMWNTCNSIGKLYREGLLDLNTLYNGSGGIISVLWLKFKPIIEMYRETEYDKRAYENFQYVAESLQEYTRKRNEGEIPGGQTLYSYQIKENN